VKIRRITMDNQLAVKLSWLAGLWDADGCYTAPRTRRGKSYKIYPEAKVANVNTTIIATVLEILNEAEVPYWVETRKSKRNHKVCTIVHVRRLNALDKFLKIIRPYAIGKRSQVDTLLAFLESRIKRTSLKYNAPISDKEHFLLSKMTLLNEKGRRYSDND
jgi:intein/homing endonuclease